MKASRGTCGGEKGESCSPSTLNLILVLKRKKVKENLVGGAFLSRGDCSCYGGVQNSCKPSQDINDKGEPQWFSGQQDPLVETDM